MMSIFECLDCQVLFAENYAKERIEIYDGDYAAWHESNDGNESQIAYAKKMAFKSQIMEIKNFVNLFGKRILDVGTGNGYLLEALRELGCNSYGTEISSHSARISEEKFPGKIFKGELKDADYEAGFFDVIFLTDVLEHLSNPSGTILEINRILKRGGFIFIISPNSGSITRKILGKKWFQYKYEHIFYFNKKSLENILDKNGFDLSKFKNNWKKFTLNYYYYYFKKYSFLKIGKLLNVIYPIIPRVMKNVPIPNFVTGEFLAIGKKR